VPQINENTLLMMNTINGLIYPTINLHHSINEKIKINTNKKNKSQFSNLRCLQNFYQEKKTSPDYLNIKEKPNSFNKNITENCLWAVKFSPNGEFLAAGGSDGLLRVYELDKNIETCKKKKI